MCIRDSSKGFIHEILNTQMCQVRHADRDRTADTLLHVLRRIAQKLAELTDADLGDRASVVVQILADPKDIVAALLAGHAETV